MTSLKSKNVSVIGAGGHTRSVIPLLRRNGFVPNGIYDDSFQPGVNEKILGVLLSGKISEVKGQLILSVGDNLKRGKLYNELKDSVVIENVFHPTSILEDDIVVGNSNLFFARSFINAGVIIGNNNIINSAAVLEHESQIGNHCHISVGALVCGRVRLGDFSFVGAGAVIKDQITVCANVIIGAGSVVVKNITESGVYAGNPARKIK